METLSYLMKSIGILTLFYLVYHTFLRRDTFFNAHRIYFLIGIVAALGIPFMTFQVYTVIEIATMPTLNLPESAVPPFTIPVTPSTPSIDWCKVAFKVYVLGAGVMFLRTSMQFYSLHRLIKKGTRIRTQECCYIEVTETVSPFTFLNDIVYNPALHTADELDMILTHERVHARQKHTIDVLLTQLLVCIHWINPLAWMYKRSLEQNLEYIADSHAAQLVSSQKAYQHTLVKVSSALLQPALTNHFYHSLIKKRIVMLNKQASSKHQQWKLSLILPFLAVFMYSFNVQEITTYKEVHTANDTLLSQDSPRDEGGKAGEKAVLTQVKTKDLAPTKTTKSQNQPLAETSQHIQVAVQSPEITVEESPKKTATTTAETTIAYEMKAELTANEEVTQAVTTPASTVTLAPVKQGTLQDMMTQDTDTYRFVITKNTTKEELDALRETLKQKHNAQLKYSNVNFNEAGEITAITIKFKDAQGNSQNYSTRSSNPINDIYVAREQGRNIIGNYGSIDAIEEARTQRRETLEAKREAMSAKRDAKREELRAAMETRREKMREQREQIKEELREERKVVQGKVKKGKQNTGYVKLDDQTYYYTKADDETKYFDRWGVQIKETDARYSQLKEQQYQTQLLDFNFRKADPLVVIDGQAVKGKQREVLKDINPDDIESVIVLKGKKAKEKYQERGLNGVIEIITKSKTYKAKD